MRDASLLFRLLEAPAPSGYEAPAAGVWREAAAAFAGVRADAIGNSYATVNAGGAPRIALLGHIDEIGLVVTQVDEDTGMLWFGPIGSWDPAVVVGQRVVVVTGDGPVDGVVGKKAWHLQSPDELARAPRLDALWIDIGARDGADAQTVVRQGDPVVLAAPPVRLRNDRLASRALDNRLGALCVLEAARLAAEAGDLRAEVVAIASVQEEITYGGAQTAAYAAGADLAVVVDVTHVSDYPQADGVARANGARGLGSGPAIGRGGAISEPIARRLLALAAEHGAAHTIEASGGRTLTEVEATQAARGGVPAGLVSIPLRYMHSPSETVQLSDVAETAELIARFCRSLAPDQEWIP